MPQNTLEFGFFLFDFLKFIRSKHPSHVLLRQFSY